MGQRLPPHLEPSAQAREEAEAKGQQQPPTQTHALRSNMLLLVWGQERGGGPTQPPQHKMLVFTGLSGSTVSRSHPRSLES